MLPLFAKRSAARGGAAPKRGHVAVCSFVIPPHPETFFLLSRMIAAANRDVWVSMFIDPTYAMYFYWYWHPEKDHNLHFVPVGDWPTSSPTPEEFLPVYLEEVGANMRESMSRVEDEFGAKITYVVADAFLADVCRGIAEERGVGWSAVWTSSAASVAAYLHGDEIIRKINDSFVDITPGVTPVGPSPTTTRALPPVDHFLPGFPPGVPISDLPFGVLLGPDAVNHFPLAKMFHNMVRSLPKADSVIVNSFNHLESAVTDALLNPNYHLGGLFSLTLPFPPIEFRDPDGIFPFLDTHLASPGSVVYINLANPTHTPPAEELHALAEALEATGVPFLWYQPWRVELPPGFLERTSGSGQGKLVASLGAWLWPVTMMYIEMEVLRHEAVGAHVKRGAWRSVAESIAAGKPIICRPVGGEVDHALNATLVEGVWGIGVSAVEFDRMTKETAERALKRVMVEEEGRWMKEKAAALRKLAEEDANGSSAQNLNEFISLVTKS